MSCPPFSSPSKHRTKTLKKSPEISGPQCPNVSHGSHGSRVTTPVVSHWAAPRRAATARFPGRRRRSWPSRSAGGIPPGRW